MFEKLGLQCSCKISCNACFQKISILRNYPYFGYWDPHPLGCGGVGWGGGDPKSQFFFKEKDVGKLEFPEGWEYSSQKAFHGRWGSIFSGTMELCPAAEQQVLNT